MPSKYCGNLPRCKNWWWCSVNYRPNDNVHCFAPLTNYDRIISKTPEQLAEFLIQDGDCPPERMYPDSCPMVERITPAVCCDCWLGWLKKEAKD